MSENQEKPTVEDQLLAHEKIFEAGVKAISKAFLWRLSPPKPWQRTHFSSEVFFSYKGYELGVLKVTPVEYLSVGTEEEEAESKAAGFNSFSEESMFWAAQLSASELKLKIRDRAKVDH